MIIIEAGRQFLATKDWTRLSATLEGRYNIHRHIRSKILAVYYPEEFPQIHKPDAIAKILIAFGVPEPQIEEGLFLNQGRAMQIKNTHPVMKNWHTIDFSHFIWTVVMDRVTRKDLQQKTVYSVEAGRDATQLGYFILRTQPGSEWQDGEGEEYHFGTNVPRHAQLVQGSLVVFDRNLNGQIEYVGSAEIDSISEEDRGRKTPEGRQVIDKIARLRNHMKLEPPINRSDEIAKIIESIPGYNNQHSIRPITREIYNMIVGRAASITLGWTFDMEKAIDPKMLFPVHSEHPEMYVRVTRNMTLVEEAKPYLL